MRNSHPIQRCWDKGAIPFPIHAADSMSPAPYRSVSKKAR